MSDKQFLNVELVHFANKTNKAIGFMGLLES